MKALTLTQPWATLVATGAKRIETRSWSTSYRGPLAIHAGKGLGPVGGRSGLMDLCRREPFLTKLVAAGYLGTPMLPLGAIVAVVELAWVVPTTWVSATGRTTVHSVAGPAEFELADQERAFGDYTPGRYAWLLRDIRALPTPIPARGGLGLWDWTPPEGFTL